MGGLDRYLDGRTYPAGCVRSSLPVQPTRPTTPPPYTPPSTPKAKAPKRRKNEPRKPQEEFNSGLAYGCNPQGLQSHHHLHKDPGMVRRHSNPQFPSQHVDDSNSSYEQSAHFGRHGEDYDPHLSQNGTPRDRLNPRPSPDNERSRNAGRYSEKQDGQPTLSVASPNQNRQSPDQPQHIHDKDAGIFFSRESSSMLSKLTAGPSSSDRNGINRVPPGTPPCRTQINKRQNPRRINSDTDIAAQCRPFPQLQELNLKDLMDFKVQDATDGFQTYLPLPRNASTPTMSRDQVDNRWSPLRNSPFRHDNSFQQTHQLTPISPGRDSSRHTHSTTLSFHCNEIFQQSHQQTSCSLHQHKDRHNLPSFSFQPNESSRQSPQQQEIIATSSQYSMTESVVAFFRKHKELCEMEKQGNSSTVVPTFRNHEHSLHSSRMSQSPMGIEPNQGATPIIALMNNTNTITTTIASNVYNNDIDGGMSLAHLAAQIMNSCSLQVRNDAQCALEIYSQNAMAITVNNNIQEVLYHDGSRSPSDYRLDASHSLRSRLKSPGPDEMDTMINNARQRLYTMMSPDQEHHPDCHFNQSDQQNHKEASPTAQQNLQNEFQSVQNRAEADNRIKNRAETDQQTENRAETDQQTQNRAETDQQTENTAETDQQTRNAQVCLLHSSGGQQGLPSSLHPFDCMPKVSQTCRLSPKHDKGPFIFGSSESGFCAQLYQAEVELINGEKDQAKDDYRDLPYVRSQNQDIEKVVEAVCKDNEFNAKKLKSFSDDWDVWIPRMPSMELLQPSTSANGKHDEGPYHRFGGKGEDTPEIKVPAFIERARKAAEAKREFSLDESLNMNQGEGQGYQNDQWYNSVFMASSYRGRDVPEVPTLSDDEAPETPTTSGGTNGNDDIENTRTVKEGNVTVQTQGKGEDDRGLTNESEDGAVGNATEIPKWPLKVENVEVADWYVRRSLIDEPVPEGYRALGVGGLNGKGRLKLKCQTKSGKVGRGSIRGGAHLEPTQVDRQVPETDGLE